MTELALAISEWDGVKRVHLYSDKGLYSKTLCGKSVLGWEKRQLGERVLTCRVCSRKHCMICGRPSEPSVCDKCCE